MFGEMRRRKQLLSREECIRILQEGTSGVLALSGRDAYPYAVPLSYVYVQDKIFFHCAKAGYKLEAIERNPKASFCVIGQDQIMPEEYTTYFRSVIVFGKMRILTDEAEKRNAIEKLAERYTPYNEKGRLQEIEREYNRLCMLELEIEQMTGKEAIELVKAKQINPN